MKSLPGVIRPELAGNLDPQLTQTRSPAHLLPGNRGQERRPCREATPVGLVAPAPCGPFGGSPRAPKPMISFDVMLPCTLRPATMLSRSVLTSCTIESSPEKQS